MVLCGEDDCGVCLLAFSRGERVPRLLHCRHVFCQACLEAMAVPMSPVGGVNNGGNGSRLSVRCPLCRRLTCVGRGLSLREALWVDGVAWERIPNHPQVGDPENSPKEEEEEEVATTQEKGIPSRNKLKLRSFFRKFTLTKRHRETIVPSGNVEMKSWRRLSSQETL
ncbi:uncharacterized protein LOC144079379 isoform X1 [Stigmatopora argus]